MSVPNSCVDCDVDAVSFNVLWLMEVDLLMTVDAGVEGFTVSASALTGSFKLTIENNESIQDV